LKFAIIAASSFWTARRIAERLPKVQPAQIRPPTQCPVRGRNKKLCTGPQFNLHRVIFHKPVRDTDYTEVIAPMLPLFEAVQAHRS